MTAAPAVRFFAACQALCACASDAVPGAAAEAMLRGATMPPFPDTMPQDRITITVRVHYALTD